MAQPKYNSKPKQYISIDIETAGRPVGVYSMLSVGACVVFDTNQQFYREIKPINNLVITDALKVCVRGFHCLSDLLSLPEFNPESEKFSPDLVMQALIERADSPQKVMQEYSEWLEKVGENKRLVELAAPIKFDGGFCDFYWGQFYDGEPKTSFTAEDINSMYRGVTKNPYANIKELGLRPNGQLPHNALEDAIIQAKEAEAVLKLMGVNSF
ncbi:hypothetical protein HN587_02715 [Candidatus Woesearchaeota archaeon]|nr:hypothetical protein [Candidatus Woesearchaeota archaeon]